MPAVNVTPSLLLGRPPTRMPVRGAATVDVAVGIIRRGGRALVSNPNLAQDVLVALGLDADAARERVVETLRLSDVDDEDLSIKAAVIRDGDGDGMIDDGTPWERPAPAQREAFEVVRMKPIADFAPHVGHPWYGVEDWGDVRVDLDKHFRTADAYMALPEFDDSPETRAAYDALIAEVNQQYQLLEELGYTIEVVAEDPYPDVKALHADLVENKRIKVLATASTPPGHAYMTDEENDRFRAVHDAFGHAGTGRGFDRHGEEAAYQAHANMFSPLARFALATETRGQNAVLIQGVELNGEGVFPPQKLALLPEEFTKTAPLAPEDFVDPDFDNATYIDGIHHRTGGRWAVPEIDADAWSARRTAARERDETKAGTRTLYHLTDDPDFELDPTFAPERNTTMGGQMRPGIFLSPSPERWVNGYNYWRPYVVEVEVPDGVGNDGGGYGGEVYVLAEDFDKVKVGRVLPLDGFARETYGQHGWIEGSTGVDTFTGEQLPGYDELYRSYPFRDGWRSPDARGMDPKWRAEWENKVQHHLYEQLGEPWTGTEPGILYHGTDSDENVQSILDDGIRPGAYLASDTRPVVNRIGYGDGRIFAVDANQLDVQPLEDYDRVFTSEDAIPPEAIVGVRWYTYEGSGDDRVATKHVGRPGEPVESTVLGKGWAAELDPDYNYPAKAITRRPKGKRKHLPRDADNDGRIFEGTPMERWKALVINQVKALPRDGDGDGMIYEGTPRERPAPVGVQRYATQNDLGNSLSQDDWERAWGWWNGENNARYRTFSRGADSSADVMRHVDDILEGRERSFGNTRADLIEQDKRRAAELLLDIVEVAPLTDQPMYRGLRGALTMAEGTEVDWPLASVSPEREVSVGYTRGSIQDAMFVEDQLHPEADTTMLEFLPGIPYFDVTPFNADPEGVTGGRFRVVKVGSEMVNDDYGSERPVITLEYVGPTELRPPEAKALPRDGDGDGLIYEGTPRERPAPMKVPKLGPAALAKAAKHEQHIHTGGEGSVSVQWGPSGSVVTKEYDSTQAVKHELWSSAIADIIGAPVAKAEKDWRPYVVHMDYIGAPASDDGEDLPEPAPTLADEINPDGEWLSYTEEAERHSQWYGTEEGRKLALLDFVIHNGDRHEGNLLVHEGKLVGIDHGGLTFYPGIVRGGGGLLHHWVDFEPGLLEEDGTQHPNTGRVLKHPWTEAEIANLSDRLDEVGLPDDVERQVRARIKQLTDTVAEVTKSPLDKAFAAQAEATGLDLREDRDWTRDELKRASDSMLLNALETFGDRYDLDGGDAIYEVMEDRVRSLMAGVPRYDGDLVDAIEEGRVTGRMRGGVEADFEIHKTPDGTPILVKHYKGNHASRIPNEVFAGVVAESMGAPIARTQEIDNRSLAIEMIEGMPGSPGRTMNDYLAGRFGQLHNLKGDQREAFYQASIDLWNTPEGKSLELFDFIVNNTDRHRNNVIVANDGTLVGIDHSFSWDDPDRIPPSPGEDQRHIRVERSESGRVDEDGDPLPDWRVTSHDYTAAEIADARAAVEGTLPFFGGENRWRYDRMIERLDMLEGALPKPSLSEVIEAANEDGPELPQGAQADVSIRKGPLGSVVIKDFYDEDNEDLWREEWGQAIAEQFGVPVPRMQTYGNTAVVMDLITDSTGRPAPTLMEWVDREIAGRGKEADDPGIVAFFEERGLDLYDRAANREDHDAAMREYEALLQRPIEAVRNEVMRTPEGKAMALFDFITGNADRHDENILVVDGKPVSIDHSQILVGNEETANGSLGHNDGIAVRAWVTAEEPDPRYDRPQTAILEHPWSREELEEARRKLFEIESWTDGFRPPLDEIRKMRERIDLLEEAL